MHNFRELQVWKKAIRLVKNVYELISEFPDAEKLGLVSQLRRCAVSVQSNIAEGSGRKPIKTFRTFFLYLLVLNLNWRHN